MQSPSPSTRAALERLAELVAASPHNLVSRSARAELLTRHVPECVALARLLPAAPARLLDIGSGGGLPGLVIAITRPDLEVHLLDSTQKKTRFLQDAAAELQVPVTVHTGRAEDLAAPPLSDGFDLVTARAVAPLPRLVGWALPFLRRDGVLYAVKGERWAHELEEALPVLMRAGGRVLATPDDIAPAGDRADGVTPRVVMIARTR
jgi:16S rRNA (guanine527-N7)-methyltransferase